MPDAPTRPGLTPDQGITQANHFICHESSHGLFVTLFYGHINPGNGEMTYVNAGHNPPLHYAASTGKIRRLTPTGIPFGIAEDFIYKQERVNFAPGDYVFCFTDGITEAINPEEVEFGLEKLERVLLENLEAGSGELVQIVNQTVSEFAQSEAQFDEMTIVVAKKSSNVPII